MLYSWYQMITWYHVWLLSLWRYEFPGTSLSPEMGDWSGVVPLSCPKAHVRVDLHPLYTYTKCLMQLLEAMHVLTSPSSTLSVNAPVFFPPCPSILWVLCSQYGCDPLTWLLVHCINLTHAPIDELRGLSTPVWMVGAHGISHTIQGRGWMCPSFHLSTHVTSSFGYYVVSMNVTPLLGF